MNRTGFSGGRLVCVTRPRLAPGHDSAFRLLREVRSRSARAGAGCGTRAAVCLVPRAHGWRRGMRARFGFCGRYVPDRLEQATVVEPVDPFERGELDGFEGPPWAPPVDHLGLEQPVDGLREGVVIRVADAADGGCGA